MDLKNEDVVAFLKALPYLLSGSIIVILLWLFLTRSRVPAETDTYKIKYNPREKTYSVEIKDGFEDQSNEEQIADYEEIYEVIDDLDGSGNFYTPGYITRSLPEYAEEQQREEDLITSQPYFQEQLETYNNMTFNYSE